MWLRGWPKRKETALRFWIYVMLDDINAECTNHRTCRILFNVMQVIRRVMTSFYTLFSQEERNCHNIWMAKVYKVVDQPGTSNVLCLTTNWNKCVLCQEDTPEVLRCPASSKRDAEGRELVTRLSLTILRVSTRLVVCLRQSIYQG